MDATTLQARINSGMGKAAARLGYTFQTYRPLSAGPAVAPANLLGAPINAEFTVNQSTYNFGKAGAHKDDLWLGIFDRTSSRVGDYLYNATHGTYYIAAMQDHLPTLCVKCTSVLSVVRPFGSPVLGVGGYSGAVPATETAVITNWPGALSLEARGRSTGANLPMDEQNPFFIAYLPFFAGTDIRPSDIMTDNSAPVRRYIVAASELSPLGWRMMVQHATS